MSLLEASDIHLQAGERLLCEGLSLHMAAGECWAILGPNGSGKTTLLHVLAGLSAPKQGTVSLDGRPLTQFNRRGIARQLGLLLQDNHDPFPATVWETVLSGRHPHLGRWQGESPQDHQLARQALHEMELGSLAERVIQSLSGGERRRLAIATLLAQDPDILLLDEPLNHLDLRHQQQLLAQLGRWQTQHKAIAMVLHEPNHALRYCNRALLLHGDGRWQAGGVEEMLTVDNLSELYHCPLKQADDKGSRWFYF